ncbi:Hypothetical predicted protein, partial [Marmota monax]
GFSQRGSHRAEATACLQDGTGVSLETLMEGVVRRNRSRLKVGKTSGSSGDSDGPLQASDTTQ